MKNFVMLPDRTIRDLSAITAMTVRGTRVVQQIFSAEIAGPTIELILSRVSVEIATLEATELKGKITDTYDLFRTRSKQPVVERIRLAYIGDMQAKAPTELTEYLMGIKTDISTALINNMTLNMRHPSEEAAAIYQDLFSWKGFQNALDSMEEDEDAEPSAVHALLKNFLTRQSTKGTPITEGQAKFVMPLRKAARFLYATQIFQPPQAASEQDLGEDEFMEATPLFVPSQAVMESLSAKLVQELEDFNRDMLLLADTAPFYTTEEELDADALSAEMFQVVADKFAELKALV